MIFSLKCCVIKKKKKTNMFVEENAENKNEIESLSPVGGLIQPSISSSLFSTKNTQIEPTKEARKKVNYLKNTV